MLTDALPVALPSSVAWSVATKVPSSSGVNEMVAPLPLAKALPFLVTLHEYVNPAELSAALALEAEPVSVTAVPSLADEAEPASDTVGGTAVTAKLNDTFALPP